MTGSTSNDEAADQALRAGLRANGLSEEAMQRITAEIDRLGFEHSSIGLARQLRMRSGISRVEVDQRTDRAAITYDETRLTASQVERLIGECGYECRSWTRSTEAKAATQ